MFTIYKPSNEQQNKFYSHSGDSFREMIDEWGVRGYVKILPSPDNYIWFGNVGTTLLYDRPTTNWLESNLKYNIGLFGNPISSLVNNDMLNVPWTFWGRHPKLLERFHVKYGKNSYEARTISSVFVGKIENEVQNKFRTTKDWGSVIDFFEMPYGKSGVYKYTQDEYLQLLSTSKFGLSVRGYGPKCHREVELMALGVVPLITPDVDITSYHEPPIENIHYLTVKEPEDVTRVVGTITKEKWEEMSKACLDWYERNVSVRGSFDTTCKIVEQYSTYRKPSSVCTLCTDMCLHDLEIFIKCFENKEPNVPIVLLCDDIVNDYIKSTNTKLDIQTVVCLNAFSNKNRKKMEAEGIFHEFTRIKADCIDKALELYPDTLLLDCDISLLRPLPFIDTSKQIGLSRHDIIKTNEDKYGVYNAGYVYTNTQQFAKWWREATKTSSFFEQKCLEDAPCVFSHFEFEITDNFGWWRLLECNDPNERARKFSIDLQLKCVLFDNKPLRSIHTHLSNDPFPLTLKFNAFIKQLAKRLHPEYTYLFSQKIETPKLNILCQYYNDDATDRQKEIDYCFKYNLENHLVKRLIHFQEPETTIPEWLSKNEKFVSVPCNERLTYKRAFQYASTYLKNEFVCVCNADIFMTMDSPWNEMYERLKKGGVVFAQSRHDFDGTRLYKDPTLQKLAYAHSQDAWFFIPPVTISDCDFAIGTLGCDNAIADRFNKSGLRPINSPNQYKIGHYDICRGKDGSNYMDQKYHALNKGKTSPEKNGYYLVPDIDAIMSHSIDQLLQSFNASVEYKYSIYCDIMTKHIKINN